MENVIDKLNVQTPTLPIASKAVICNSSSDHAAASPVPLTSAEKLNLSSDMAPVTEVVTEDSCPSTQAYEEPHESVSIAKEQQIEFEQTVNKDVANFCGKGETVKMIENKETDMCQSTATETNVSLVALAQENDADHVIMQQDHIDQEEIRLDESTVIATIDSEPSKPFECTNIILVTDSTQTGTDCQIVETEDVEAKIPVNESSSSGENSSQTNSSSTILKNESSEEPVSSQWSLHTNSDVGESAKEKNISKETENNSVGQSSTEETYIAVREDTQLVSVQDADMQSDECLTAETLIAISILQDSSASMNSEYQESESKSEKVVEQTPMSVENSKQTGMEIGIQANDYEIERNSGKVPARRRVVPFKFIDYRNPDLVGHSNDSDSDYCPSENEVRLPKQHRVTSSLGPVGRKRGRPRKIRPEVEQKQTGSADNTASSAKPEKSEKSIKLVPQTNSIAQEMVSSKINSTSEKRREKSSTSNSFNKNNYACKICQHSFTQKGNLKVHMRLHTGEKPFLCTVEECTKQFRTSETLRRHNLTHLGIKPFECNLCEKKFSSKVSLQEHKAIHSNSKPQVCHVCKMRFRQVSCLRRHLITHSTKKPFECMTCGQKFSQMVYLKSHSRVHTGEKPYICDQCKRGFSHQSDLIRHKIIHTGKKPYECHICYARFSDASTRRRHVKEHKGIMPYSCPSCNDSFKRAGQLKVHISRKHSNKIDNTEEAKQGQTLQFEFKDANKLSSITIDEKSSAYHKKIAQIVEGLTGSEVTHIATPVNVDDVVLQETNSVMIKEHEVGESQTVAQVVASAMQSAGMASLSTCNDGQLSAICQVRDFQERESNFPDQITATIVEEDIPSLIEGTSDGSTVITIVSLEDVEQEQEQEQICADHTEYAPRFIENEKGDIEVHYEQNDETIKEEQAVESQMAVTESEKPERNDDFVFQPDFSCQEYYDWLSNFTEVCKTLPMPLNPDIFYKISQVHKTLSDVMADPSGIIADKDNFKILMHISRDLYFIITEHLAYILKNLNEEKNMETH